MLVGIRHLLKTSFGLGLLFVGVVVFGAGALQQEEVEGDESGTFETQGAAAVGQFVSEVGTAGTGRSGTSSLPEQSIRYSQRIELAYDQNNLAFELSDLPYSLEEKSKLVYRLEGVDREWNLLKANTNRITYNNLSYGDYRLLVSKLDAYGKPSDRAYTLEVHIIPPWYYTPWAKALYVLLCLILVVWTINFFRVKNRLKLERMEKEKILEQSQAKMEFFTNLSHDLKTPLSMIIAPISKLLPGIKDQQEKKQLEQVHRNAMKLNSLIHQGLDFNRVDSGNNTLLILSQIELVSFARGLFALYAEEKAKEKKLTFHFHTDREKIYIQMDAIKLESILDNLLSNAVKYTPEEGEVTLRLQASDKEVIQDRFQFYGIHLYVYLFTVGMKMKS